jgi:hypothetical protein
VWPLSLEQGNSVIEAFKLVSKAKELVVADGLRQIVKAI